MGFSADDLDDFSEQLERCFDERDFDQLLAALTERAGFDIYHYGIGPSTIKSPHQIAFPPSLTSFSEQWIEAYTRENLQQYDNAVLHVMSAKQTVFRYSVDGAVQNLKGEVLKTRQRAIQNGLGEGFALPIMESAGAIGCLVLAADIDSNIEAEFSEQDIARLQCFAHRFQQRFFRNLPSRFYADTKNWLTSRQREIMRLVMFEAMTAAQVAQKLERSKKTIENTIFAVQQRLGAKNQAQAAAICALWHVLDEQ